MPHQCQAQDCNKTFAQSQGLARHIRNEQKKEAYMEEQLRVHRDLVVRPKGRALPVELEMGEPDALPDIQVTCIV